MGGPALHVSYLTEGLTARGYETTLLAGQLARGEDSMAFVADDLKIPVRNDPAAPPRDLPDLRPDRDPPDRPRDPARPAADPAYPYREGRSRRSRGGVARRRCPPTHHRAHVSRACSSRLFRSGPHRVLPEDRTGSGSAHEPSGGGEPRGARRPRRPGRRAGKQVLGDPARHRPADAGGEPRRARGADGACSASRNRRSWSAGSAG